MSRGGNCRSRQALNGDLQVTLRDTFSFFFFFFRCSFHVSSLCYQYVGRVDVQLYVNCKGGRFLNINNNNLFIKIKRIQIYVYVFADDLFAKNEKDIKKKNRHLDEGPPNRKSKNRRKEKKIILLFRTVCKCYIGKYLHHAHFHTYLSHFNYHMVYTIVLFVSFI